MRTPDERAHAAAADAAAMRAAVEPPVLAIGGLTYRGRVLSIEEWLAFAERADGARGNMKALLRLYRDFLTAVFPPRRYKWWAPKAADLVMRRPFDEIQETVLRFFVLHLRWHGLQLEDETATASPSPAPGSGSTG